MEMEWRQRNMDMEWRQRNMDIERMKCRHGVNMYWNVDIKQVKCRFGVKSVKCRHGVKTVKYGLIIESEFGPGWKSVIWTWNNASEMWT